MRRTLAIVWTIGLLAIAGPARAQEEPSSVPPDSGSIEPARVDTVDAWISAVAGNDRGQVRVGAPTEVTVTATNNSQKVAEDVKVSITSGSGAEVTPSVVSFGDLKPEGGSAERPVTVEIASAENCQDYIGLEGSASSSLGENPVKFGISVLCPGPRLGQEIIEFVGGDGDNIPEPGETLKVFVSYRNIGADPAHNVEATMMSKTDGVKVTGSKATWGTIGVDDVVRAGTPFVIEIAKDAPVQDNGCSWGGGTAVDGGEPAPDQPPSETTVSSEGSSGGGTSSSGTTTTSEPAQDQPVSQEPQEAPEPGPAGEPRSEDPSVGFVGELRVTSDEMSFDDVISNQMVCMMSESGKGGAPTGGVPDGAVQKGDVDDALAAGAREGATQDRGPAIAISAVLLAAVGSQVGWRLKRSRT